jgi:hypothetical protein
MIIYELTNEQRKYFGLEPIENHWDRVILSGDKYRPDTILYFDKDIIKRHIISIENKYHEKQYNELTRNRNILLPKTDKGKEKKLTASVLEQQQPVGVYMSIVNGHLSIGNYNSQTTFYSTTWDNEKALEGKIADIINGFISNSPPNHLTEIETYKQSKRKNIKFKSGDYFCFKLDRINFGFGRVLLNIGKIRKKNLIDDGHGLNLLMGLPVIVELFAFKSTAKNIDITMLDQQPKLPADVMMDNLLLYGEFEIIGNRELKDEEFDLPISYGRSLNPHRKVVFLQWGLIHKELSWDTYCKYIGEDFFNPNPYGYYSIGFRPFYNSIEVLKTIENNGIYNFDNAGHYKAKWDLRNPKNKAIREELFTVFGLDPHKSYFENSKLAGTKLPSEIIKELK